MVRLRKLTVGKTMIKGHGLIAPIPVRKVKFSAAPNPLSRALLYFALVAHPESDLGTCTKFLRFFQFLI